MPTRSIRSRVPSRITNALPRGDLDRLLQGRGHRGEQLECLAHVAVDRRGPDPEAAGQIRIGLALAQVGDHQQGLAARPTACASGSPARAGARFSSDDRDRRQNRHDHHQDCARTLTYDGVSSQLSTHSPRLCRPPAYGSERAGGGSSFPLLARARPGATAAVDHVGGVLIRSLAWHLRGIEGNTAAPITRQSYRVTALRADGGLTVAPIVERGDAEGNVWASGPGLTVFPHLSGARLRGLGWYASLARTSWSRHNDSGPANRCRAIFRWCGHCRASWRTSGSDGVACRARCSRGAADDQLWFQRDVLRFACRLVESLDDGFDGGSGLLLDVLADGGEIDPGESSEPGVVVPDDRQIAGHGDTCPEDGVESPMAHRSFAAITAVGSGPFTVAWPPRRRHRLRCSRRR